MWLDSEIYVLIDSLIDWFISEIPDSLSWIPDSKAQDSGFLKKKFPGFQILQAKVSRILEITLHRAINC